ncbi:Patatin-like phospholipase [Sulfitobacter sp. THAF37]|uniref:patatin-like phospholipase family protein n=1 Tax=Sulfitobacter sp. THAF37 TaxID=2587855 RepID=UPI0012A8834D|nr:Patatin-like phospholipase [Sulfitobacter sp. THAF37]
MSAPKSHAFEQLVCSGGGTRCCWQGGWLDVVRDEIGLNPDRITGVSGGAGTAAGFITRRGRMFLDGLCSAFSDLESNMDPHAIGEDGWSPHQRMYREVAADIFDASAMAEVADGPPFQILIGHPPAGALARLTGTAATLAYEAELHLIGSPHFDWAEKIGVTSTLVDARQAAAEGKLAELICAAAVIPPLFEPPLWDGKPVIDGGMADQAPMPQPDQGRTLILLTRPYDRIPQIEQRSYISPTKRSRPTRSTLPTRPSCAGHGKPAKRTGANTCQSSAMAQIEQRVSLRCCQAMTSRLNGLWLKQNCV